MKLNYASDNDVVYLILQFKSIILDFKIGIFNHFVKLSKRTELFYKCFSNILNKYRKFA